MKGPQTIYDIHKKLKAQKRLRHIRYASTNKRVRSLEEQGYVSRIGAKETKAGFQASLYELTAKAYLATHLNLISLDELLVQLDNASAMTLLAEILNTMPTLRSPSGDLHGGF